MIDGSSGGAYTRSRCSRSSLVSLLGLYALLRLQAVLPFNPTDRELRRHVGAFNVAVSFVTNTNWQWYSGEVAMSHLSRCSA